MSNCKRDTFRALTTFTMTKSSNMKYIFVTGGVVSSLGKGLTAGALGALLEQRGKRLSPEELESLSGPELQKKLTEALRTQYGENPEDLGGGSWLARYHGETPLLFGWKALALVALGREDEARLALDEALALDARCSPALEARERLED